MDWNGKPYHSLDFEMKRRFGTKVYKIALDGGMTCPNRDGTLDTRGCIFCSAGGSGDFAEPLRVTDLAPKDGMVHDFAPKSCMVHSFAPKSYMPHDFAPKGGMVHSSALKDRIWRQIDAAAARIEQKLGASPRAFIAYFQSYTNTYAPVPYLRELFTAAISHPDVKALSIATRPDCLPEQVTELCAELNQIKPVWLELGLQTIHPATASFIRRGYDLECFEASVARLRRRGLETIVHVILGLPGETREQMLETVSYLAHSDIQGVKLQLLHVLDGTDLARIYRQDPFPVFSMEEYLDLIIDCVALLPPEMVVHRLTGDGPKRLLIAPLWSANKRLVLNTLTRRFRERGLTQGCLYETQSRPPRM